jgi:hypothetical protein
LPPNTDRSDGTESSILAQHQTTRKKQCGIIRRFLLVAVVMSQGGSPRSTVNGSR